MYPHAHLCWVSMRGLITFKEIKKVHGGGGGGCKSTCTVLVVVGGSVVVLADACRCDAMLLFLYMQPEWRLLPRVRECGSAPAPEEPQMRWLWWFGGEPCRWGTCLSLHQGSWWNRRWNKSVCICLHVQYCGKSVKALFYLGNKCVCLEKS